MTSAVAVPEQGGRGGLTVVPEAGPEPAQRLRAAGEQVLVALIDRLAGMACEKVDDLAAGLEDAARNGGVGVGAAIGAGKAKLDGRSVVWGAIKGGFAALGVAAKVLVAVVVALAPVFLVLAVVVLIVAALVWAIVAAVRAIGG